MKEEEILQAIEQADDFFMRKILDSVIERYAKFYPEWEIMFLSYQKEKEARAKDIDAHIRLLKKIKNDSLV